MRFLMYLALLFPLTVFAGQADLTWDLSSPETYVEAYEIDAAIVASDALCTSALTVGWNNIAAVTKGTSTYSDMNIPEGQTTCYRVWAWNQDFGRSLLSTNVGSKRIPFPEAPSAAANLEVQ